MKPRLNGRWVNKSNPLITVFIEKVYKKGHVTGFQYQQTDQGQVIGKYKATYEELEKNFMRNQA